MLAETTPFSKRGSGVPQRLAMMHQCFIKDLHRPLAEDTALGDLVLNATSVS
ncbi:hypothetical protein QLQ86_11160 [Halomonas sp. LR5S13]|uniref:hypothetical protein n=1 Tax=Halomonas rhizosphaerae TaxID=3043296 RepID=UPI0024A8B3C7|nr:hypothetical protein [Halomonas rhizosphaerae]MDI5921344.1 hypothetical protein [Halomonas rhizosphaerae]